MPEAYERALAPAVFRPFAVDLARRVAGRKPDTVLELAAGTGVLTRELAGAAVTATDLNQSMVDFGRPHAPKATWQQADAMDLPFGDAMFDLVVCQFGVMFFPDKAGAFAEASRVLRPGGALLFNVWDALETHEFEAAVVAGLERAFPDDPPTFLQTTPHGYANPEQILTDVADGGLRDVTLETISLEGHAASAADLARGYCTGTPLRAEIEVRGDLATAIAAVTGEMQRRLGIGPVTGRMTAHVVHALNAVVASR